MKVVYMIAGTYRSGGMERVLTDKANWLVQNCESDVLIVTTDQRGRNPYFDMDKRIRCIDLDINYEENNGASFLNKILKYPFKLLYHRIKLTALLKKEHPDIVVSMFCNDAVFVPRINDGSSKVLEIHFSRYKRLQYGRTGLWALADLWRNRNDLKVVQQYDRFVVLTEEDRKYWEMDAPISNIMVIPNPRTFSLDEMELTVVSNKTVLAVGRYNEQKAFDRLIDAWQLLKSDTDGVADGWKLRLVGDGELRDELQSQIDRLSLTDSVILGGAETDMVSVYQNADIYAMTSLYEGLPMVLLEAQAAGLPIVSMACKCGPRDVVTDGVNGFIVPDGDVGAFARRLAELMSDSDMRQRMGREAWLNSSRFDKTQIMPLWERMFRELSDEHPAI